MSWLFGSGKSKKKRAYALLQDNSSDDGFSDDSEEEHVIFRNSDQLELKLYPKARGANTLRRSKFYCACIFLSITLVLASAVVVAIVLVKTHSAGHDKPSIGAVGVTPKVPIKRPPVNGTDSGDWTATLDTSGEGGVAVLDVDGDGLDDILIATMKKLPESIDSMSVASAKFSAVHEACEKAGLTYPCFGEIVAVKGTNGKELWRLPVRSETFLTMCDIDIDKDGRKDCISTGRHATAVAYDPYTPKVLWTAEDDNFMKAHWNMYRAVILPDWNADGVPEVLLTHGGDPTKNADEHDRESGRLIVVSGATGTPMGEQYLAMPNSKETYMSSVIYRPTDTSTDYILFGSGGETVPGDLMTISMYDFCVHTMGKNGSSVCTKTGDQDIWPGAEKSDIGIITLIRGQRKGVMVPPVIVDMDKDGYMDLVVSLYDGAVVLINGKTLKVVWKVDFPDMESYSTPAPGYFDDDDVLDFMVHWCKGAWEVYYGTTTYIISGASGKIIWTLFSPFYQMTSGLIVNQQAAKQDLFLFRLQGRGSGFKWGDDGVIIRPGDKPHRTRRHGKHTVHHRPALPGYSLKDMNKRYHLVCDEDLSHFTNEIFLMDKTMVTEPLLMLEVPMPKMKYNISYEDHDSEDLSDEDLDDEDFDDEKLPMGDDGLPPEDTDATGEGEQDTRFGTEDDTDDWQDGDFLPDDEMDDGTDGVGGGTGGVEDGVGTDTKDRQSDATSRITNHKSAMKPTGSHIGKRGGRSKRHEGHEESTGQSQMCVVAKVDTRTTGVIADVDGDGRLDYISVLAVNFDEQDEGYSFLDTVYSSVIHKVSLETRYINGTFQHRHVDAKTSLKSASSASTATGKAGNVFLPLRDQKWARYFANNEVYS